MTASKSRDKKAARKTPTRGERVWVEDLQGRRPFMRGIMVHSLMARGVSFDDAYRTADWVGERVKGRGAVAREELAKLVAEFLGRDILEDHRPPLPVAAPIAVGTARRSRPFSKGELSQSLLAASLDPNDAFEVAREIELEIPRRGSARISRSALRRMAHERLLERFGAETAARYLVWREHQDPAKPVIVLLGGTTGVGKTSISLEVALRLGIRRVLSTDSIRQVMRITLTPELVPALHASSFEAHRHLATTSDDNPVIDGFMAQTEVVSVGVRAMIDRAIEEQTSLVLDGVSIVPGLLDLDVYRDRANVIFLLVARLDEEAFRSHFTAPRSRRRRRGGRRYLDNFDGILAVQDHLLELADRYDVPIVDNQSLDSSVLLVIRHVVEAVDEQENPDAGEVGPSD